MLLLFRGRTSAKVIVAGTATLALSPVGATVAVRRIDAGTALLRFLPEGALVTVTAVEVAVVPTQADIVEEQLAASHQPRSRLITLTGARAVVSTYNPTTITLTGTVTYDRRREVRRTASLQLVDVDRLAPTAYGDEFSQGELFQVDRGVRVSGANIYDLLGIFEVRSFEASGGTLSLSGEDPSVALVQDVGEVIGIPAGTRASDALRFLWEPVLGAGEWDLDDGGMALSETRTINEDDERLHVAVQLMADLALDVYMDRRGYPVLRPIADPNTLPVSRTYRTRPGEARATSISRSGDRQPYNRMIVIGEPATGSPVRGVADITDPSSPIHRDRIGLRVAPIHRSATITTQYQANLVAQAMLIEASMWSDSVVWVGVPDPRLEAGEVIAVVDELTKTNARYRIESVSLPVAQGPMTLECSQLQPMFATTTPAPVVVPVPTPTRTPTMTIVPSLEWSGDYILTGMTGRHLAYLSNVTGGTGRIVDLRTFTGADVNLVARTAPTLTGAWYHHPILWPDDNAWTDGTASGDPGDFAVVHPDDLQGYAEWEGTWRDSRFVTFGRQRFARIVHSGEELFISQNTYVFTALADIVDFRQLYCEVGWKANDYAKVLVHHSAGEVTYDVSGFSAGGAAALLGDGLYLTPGDYMVAHDSDLLPGSIAMMLDHLTVQGTHDFDYTADQAYLRVYDTGGSVDDTDTMEVHCVDNSGFPASADKELSVGATVELAYWVVVSSLPDSATWVPPLATLRAAVPVT